jgi:hypothetical protein
MNFMRSIQLGGVASLLAGAILVSATRSEASCVTKTTHNTGWTCNNGAGTTGIIQTQDATQGNRVKYTLSGGSAFLALACTGSAAGNYSIHTGIWDPVGQPAIYRCFDVGSAYSKCGDTADCGNYP